jgi:predicted ATP-grasp superfamily ATP-dependent carboligase
LTDAVVVGFEANGLGVARALGQERIPAIAVTGSAWNPSWHTRYAHRIVKCREWSADCVLNTLIQLGKELSAPAPLLITKDEPVLWISARRDELSRYFKIALPDDEIVQVLMSKLRFEEYAKKRQWPLPGSWTMGSRAELDACIDDVRFPCIVKPAVKTSEFRRNSPSKAFKAANRDELVRAYEMVRQWEPEIIVQEWISGGDDRVTYGLGCWSTDGTPLAVFAGRKLRQWPPECGGTAIAAPAPKEWSDAVLSLTTRIMSDVAYRGLGSVEFKMRPDGSPVIMEPTVGRTNYQNEVAVLNGVNIPAAAYYDLLGRADDARRWSNVPPSAVPVKLIDSENDRRSAALSIKAGKLTAEQWRQSRSGRRKFMVFRVDDPMPFAAIALRRILSFAKHRVAKVVRPRNRQTDTTQTSDPLA